MVTEVGFELATNGIQHYDVPTRHPIIPATRDACSWASVVRLVTLVPGLAVARTAASASHLEAGVGRVSVTRLTRVTVTLNNCR